MSDTSTPTIPTLLIYMGLPASGKSQAAGEYVATHPDTIIVCKDDIRLAHPPPDGKWTLDYERKTIMPAETLAILEGLRSGKSVIVDSTNFAHEYRLRHLARTAGARAHVVYFGTPVDLCIARDRLRLPPKQIGAGVIARMAMEFADQIRYHNLVPSTNKGQYRAIVAEVDGVLALPIGRDPMEWARCSLDAVNTPIRIMLYDAWRTGRQICLVTYRPVQYHAPTTEWLKNVAGIPTFNLIMRPTQDTRSVVEVKLDLFNSYIRGKYEVDYVLEERTRCVRLYRALGLTTLQVAEGDF